MKFWIKLMLGIVIIISVILSFSRYITVRQNFINSLDKEIKQNANKHKLSRYYLDSNIIAKIQQGEEFTEVHMYEYIKSLYEYMEDDIESVEIYTEDNVKIISTFGKSYKLKIDNIDDLLDKEVDKYIIREIENENYMIFSSYYTVSNFSIYIVNIYDITSIYNERSRQLKDIMYTDFIVLAISSIVIAVFAKFLTKPIEELNNVTKKISSGDFKERVNVKANDEIGELANSFNKMAEEIENKINSLNLSIKQKDDFISGFSHEIKTPMTAIIGYSDLLRLKNYDDEVRIPALNYIYSESKRLEELSYKLLSLMEISEDKIEFKVINIKDFIEKICRKIILDNIELKLDLEEAKVKIDENLLEVVMRNLIQNAKKADPKDNCIYVIGKNIENRYIVSVIDNGIGIPKEHIERVTEDFYMVDKSRSRKNGGTGIGLSLCKKILELHNSKINIESEENLGTRVFFELEVID